MKILLEGDSTADYLAKIHEAYRTGLRSVYDTQLFGKGYPGFDPTIRSYCELIQRLYPERPPDLLIPFYEMLVTEPKRFRFDDLAEIEVTKGIFIGDSWHIIDNYREEFVDIIDKNKISLIFSYFPMLLNEYSGTPLAGKIFFTPPCYDPEIFRDWNQDKIFDVGFLADGTTNFSTFYPERWAIHQQLLNRKDIRYLWAQHPGWGTHSESAPLVGKNFSKAINTCKIFITTAGKYLHPNPKYVEILASKSCLFAQRPLEAARLGLEDGINYVEIDEHCLFEKLDHYLAHPDLCSQIAAAGFELAQERHTCFARAREIGSIVEQSNNIAPPQKGDFSQTKSSINMADNVLNVPEWLLMDDNHSEPIALPPAMKELVLSSAPQYTLYRLIRHIKPRKILEIGTQLGASAVAMALAMRDNGTEVDITCIDPFLPSGDNDGSEILSFFYNTILQSGYLTNGIKLILGKSNQFLPHTKEIFDFVVIDGSHEYDWVKYDFINSLPLTKLGGYLWLHDYVIYESVRNACNEVVVNYQLPFFANSIQRNGRGDLCGWALVRNLPYQHLRGHKDIEIKLNLGCGEDYKPNYINIDLDPKVRADARINLCDIDQIFDLESVSEIFMNHSIGYLPLWEARDLFKKTHLLLKPSGRLIIETPNLEQAIKKIIDAGSNFNDHLEGVRAFHAFGIDQLEKRERYIPYSFSWSPTHLVKELQSVGYENVSVLPAKHHSPWRDMRVEALKKKP